MYKASNHLGLPIVRDSFIKNRNPLLPSGIEEINQPETLKIAIKKIETCKLPLPTLRNIS